MMTINTDPMVVRGGRDMVEAIKGLDQLCAERGIDVKQVAERSGLDEGRVLAIALGAWTPSPQERDAIAKVFGLDRAK